MKLLKKILQFLREVRSELRKVVWPSRQETMMFTVVVILSVAAVTLVFWVLDSVFAELFKLVVG